MIWSSRSNLTLFFLSVLLGAVVTVCTIRMVHQASSFTAQEWEPVYNNRLPRTDNGDGGDNPPCSCPEQQQQPELKEIELDANIDERTYVPAENPTHFSRLANNNILESLPAIFMITPTYKRHTQKVDLVRLCQTLMLVQNITWIVVEDSKTYSKLVTNVLSNCHSVRSVHLHARTTTFVSRRKGGGGHRGVEQRNKGLQWIRENHGLDNVSKGVVYFGDDDNGYDVRLFDEMRFTNVISIWPVAFVGMLRYEGPNCRDGKVMDFHTSFRPDRTFPVDMGAFALNLRVLMAHSDIYIDHKSEAGMLESNFLKSLGLTKEMLEPRAKNCKEIYVWHTKTEKPKMPYERRNPGDKTIEV